MITKRGRIATWKALALLSVAVVLVVILCGVWINSSIERKWGGMERRIGELRAISGRRSSSRPVLIGNPMPGNAWENYMKAARILKQDGNVYSPSLGKREPRVREQVLQYWGAGLQNDQCLPSLSGGEMTADEILSALLKILEAAVEQAERDRTKEISPEVASALVRRYLDIARFALDLGQNTNYGYVSISESAWEESLSGLRDLLKSGPVEGPLLDQMDRALNTLDVSFPRFGGSLLNVAADEGDRLMNEDPCIKVYDLVNVQRIPIKPDWRYFYSMKLLKADVFFRFEEYAAAVSECEEKPWPDALQKLRLLDTTLREHANPADFPLISNKTLQYLGRDIRTRIRLLRVAVRYLATAQLLELEDGYGEKLRQKVVEGRFKAWSVGRNGVDHGGVGNWTPTEGKDMVLEVER